MNNSALPCSIDFNLSHHKKTTVIKKRTKSDKKWQLTYENDLRAQNAPIIRKNERWTVGHTVGLLGQNFWCNLRWEGRRERGEGKGEGWRKGEGMKVWYFINTGERGCRDVFLSPLQKYMRRRVGQWTSSCTLFSFGSVVHASLLLSCPGSNDPFFFSQHSNNR